MKRGPKKVHLGGSKWAPRSSESAICENLSDMRTGSAMKDVMRIAEGMGRARQEHGRAGQGRG